jgi:hypothetical protein
MYLLIKDFLRINRNGFNQMLRSRIDYYTRIQPDIDAVCINNFFRLFFPSNFLNLDR